MWNDPLGYLITFRTRGSWLHGDQRGSVSRHRNKFGTKYLPPETNWLETNGQRLKISPVTSSAAQRRAVEDAIKDTCARRNWSLVAINARTNHVHSVVRIGETKPESALNAFKANATRLMRERGLWSENGSPWVDKGSKRWLWNEKAVGKAAEYVITGQGDDLPDFT